MRFCLLAVCVQLCAASRIKSAYLDWHKLFDHGFKIVLTDESIKSVT